MKADTKATPRRPVEREYLATLNDAVPLDKWRAICERAAEDALDGDGKARDWLTKHLLGVENRPLTTLVAEESGGTMEEAADAEIEARRESVEFGRTQDEEYRDLIRSMTATARPN
jgi:hypothetical protein